MSNARSSVTVRVPASTSNCGAGFDSLGLALALYNRVTLTRCDAPTPQPDRSDDARAPIRMVCCALAVVTLAAATTSGTTAAVFGNACDLSTIALNPVMRPLGQTLALGATCVALAFAAVHSPWIVSGLVLMKLSTTA